MPHTVYILQSQVDGSYYIGYTSDLTRRIEEHNSGRTRYTSRKLPWILVYSESYSCKTAAVKRERFLKKQRNKAFYQRLIETDNPK